MSKKEQILQEAEDRVRIGGYNNVSFRDLAEAVGIKSASVHYHFPTKADLGAAIAKRYTENFLLKLGNPSASFDAGKDPIVDYVHMFRQALVQDKKMCLCGMLSAEADGLPEAVQQETKAFFERNIDWLANAYQSQFDIDNDLAKTAAAKLISQLEGALLVSRALSSDELFENIVGDLKSTKPN